MSRPRSDLVNALRRMSDLIPIFLLCSELKVTTTFPNNPLAIVNNGQANRVVFNIQNPPSADRVLALTGITGAWLNPKKSDGQRGRVVRNMTTTTFKNDLRLKTLSGKPLEVPFDFWPEFKPQDMGVEFRLLLRDGQTSKKHNVVAYQGSVTVIEPPKSWLDLQLLSVYLLGIAIVAGAAWFIREQLAPAPAKKRGSSSRTSAGAPVGVTKPTMDSESATKKAYDEDWIPAGHLKTKTKTTDSISSGDEGRRSPIGGPKRRK